MSKAADEDLRLDRPRSAQRVEAVERAFSILEAFADGSPRLSLAEITRRTGFYRSTVLRLYGSLNAFGYLDRDADGQFRLGPTLLRLGSLYQSAFDLAGTIRPVLEVIARETGETAAWYIRRGDSRVCVFRHHSSKMIRHILEEGAVLSLDAGASAWVLRAHSGEEGTLFDRVRAEGHYISMGERDSDTGAMAVPVFGAGGTLAGALNVSGLRTHFSAAEDRARILAILQGQAEQLTRKLGG